MFKHKKKCVRAQIVTGILAQTHCGRPWPRRITSSLPVVTRRTTLLVVWRKFLSKSVSNYLRHNGYVSLHVLLTNTEIKARDRLCWDNKSDKHAVLRYKHFGLSPPPKKKYTPPKQPKISVCRSGLTFCIGRLHFLTWLKSSRPDLRLGLSQVTSLRSKYLLKYRTYLSQKVKWLRLKWSDLTWVKSAWLKSSQKVKSPIVCQQC